MGLGVEITLPAGADKLDAHQLMSALRAASPELAKLLQGRVEDRTPVRTGALKEDIGSKAYTSEVSGSRRVKLVDVFCGEEWQLGEWKRVYAAYQEGGVLGLPTYTNGPHEMFARISTDDTALIQAWADKAVQSGLDELTSGVGSETLSYGDA